MRRIANGVVCIAFLALGLSGCGTLKSEFNYAGDATETATLLVPEPLRVRSVDGQAAGLPMMLTFPYTMTLSAGPHTLAFQYGESWGLGRSNELVRSPIMELNFNARSGEAYQLDFLRPESVDNHDLAGDYIASFNAWLVDAQGERIAARSTGSAGGLGRTLGGMVSEAPAAVETSSTPVAKVKAESVAAPRENLESLQQLWQSASEEEKKTFMQWVIAPGS